MASTPTDLADLETFRAFLDRAAVRVEQALSRHLPDGRLKPTLLHRAMRYTALSDGKRLRPALVLLAYETGGGRGRKADPVAAALEMVHAFSLIHDDLPCMDDDDMRRGKPSNHVVYGEGVAVLAGDALLNQAFLTLARLRRGTALGPEIASRLVEELADATGSVGVVGGQVLDLQSEGSPATRSTVEFIHRNKTARLFTAALRLGGIAAGAGRGVLDGLTRYGEAMGMAFQIVDDILGAAGTFRELGRDPGRDQALGKVTYPAVAGMPAAHRAVDRYLRAAGTEAARFPAWRDRYRGFVALVDHRRRDGNGSRLGLKEAP